MQVSHVVGGPSDLFTHELSVWQSFSHTTNLQQMTTNRISLFKIINECEIIKKIWKHCDKRRNSSLWAISPFVTMISISHLLHVRQNVSACGKVLNPLAYTSWLFKTFSKFRWWEIPLFNCIYMFKSELWDSDDSSDWFDGF